MSNSVKLCVELLHISHVLILLVVHEFRYASYLKTLIAKGCFIFFAGKRRHHCQRTTPSLLAMLVIFIPSYWKTLACKYD